MIVINQNQANTIAVTLNEKTSLSSPEFLFCFTNDATQVQTCFIASDTSSYTDRYNLFTITENTVEDLPNGTVNLKDGFYTYQIYEQPVSGNLDPDNATAIVETGRVKVIGEATTFTTYNSQTTTYTVYEG